ncbi:hypothetical protein [Nonomuraea sp. NPDC049480]|uniref:hypothetical protein n=1 Tax=Nonomuraea sp. NPDC049480 TaxID=3364353 RepID=UPI0037964769
MAAPALRSEPNRARSSWGRRKARVSAGEIVVFDSTGTAVQDVALAQALYAAAVKTGAGRRPPCGSDAIIGPG